MSGECRAEVEKDEVRGWAGLAAGLGGWGCCWREAGGRARPGSVPARAWRTHAAAGLPASPTALLTCPGISASALPRPAGLPPHPTPTHPQLQGSRDFRLNYRLFKACSADMGRLCAGAWRQHGGHPKQQQARTVPAQLRGGAPAARGLGAGCTAICARS